MRKILAVLPLLLLATLVCGQKRDNQMVLGTGDNSTTIFSGTLTVTPIEPGFVYVMSPRMSEGRDMNKDGIISGSDIVSGTVDYSTGAISVTFKTAPGQGKDVIVRWIKSRS